MNEQEERNERSEKILIELGSDFLPSLPLIETEEETRLRTPEEVGERIICLIAIAAAADGLEKDRILEWLQKNSLMDTLSARERSFLENIKTDNNLKRQFTWYSECVWLLLWALKKVERSLPTEQCTIHELLQKIPEFGSDISEFLKSLELRGKKEIVDLSDFIYRAHWTTRKNQTDKTIKIGSLNPDVVQEWHHAINWLTWYDDIEDWDEITTDT
jgi:hypothetical protein